MKSPKTFFDELRKNRATAPLHFRIVEEFFAPPCPDEIRLLALLLLIRNAQGDAALDLSDLTKLREKFANDADESTKEYQSLINNFPDLTSAIASLNDASQFSEIIKRIDCENDHLNDDNDDEISLNTQPLLIYSRGSKKLYSQKLFVASQIVFANAQRIFATPKSAADKTDLISGNFKLDAQQEAAVRRGANGESLLITGGPGTGKTSVASSIVRNIVAKFKRDKLPLGAGEIVLTAFSGKAAARLQESFNELAGEFSDLDFSAKTIHRLLSWRGENFFHNAKNRLPQKIFIIDEAGMIHLELFAALLSAIPDDAQVFLLGDQHQLPSIEAGAVFADLLRNFSEHAIELTHSHRAQGKILATASAIASDENISTSSAFIEIVAGDNSGDEIKWENFLDKESVFFSANDDDTKNNNLKNLVKAWAAYHRQQSAAKEFLADLKAIVSPIINDPLTALPQRVNASADFLKKWDEQVNFARILTLTRRDDFGCEKINAAAISALSPSSRSAHIADGCPLLICRNLRTMQLSNGDTGVALAADKDKGKFFVVFNHKTELEIFTLSTFDAADWEPAIATTVHKAQGSEFEHVLLVLPKDESPMLSREIVYTGVTRAKKFCGIFGTESALKKAINSPVDRAANLDDFRPR